MTSITKWFENHGGLSTDSEIVKICAKELCVLESSVRSTVYRLRSKNKIKTKSIDPSMQVYSLKKQVDNLNNEMRKMQIEYGDLQSYFSSVPNIVKELVISRQQREYKVSTAKKKINSICEAVLIFSDWHYGAIQNPDEIECFNSFSPEILETRIKNLCEDFIRWINVLRKGYTIHNLIIIDVGDNISGDIHNELSITNAFPVPVQAFKCGVFKGEIISSLCPFFKNVTVEFVTADNHGRLTKKPQSKQEGLNTHNYVVGSVAKLVSSKQDNLTFNIYPQNSKVVSVLNRNYLLTHGHGIMGWAGFPYYGIERKVAKEALARFHEPDFNRFHKVMMGHYHAPLAHPWYWINGSASGTDAFDHKQGRRSAPIQCAHIVHPEHGEFNRCEFVLRDE